ncbi:Osmosensitive K channel His kinase sensor [Chlorobium limicola DSM 245]|uniref:Osmosensitive K channel His kinase sensor n=1 Tax=Chlorobium limicola (strain DSM 245 / NBRC 103803 / 6330) TaxID=290315 RepID=B3EEH7_CHLL2|nr:PTS sugar transporter subunit IIA [Chlorobium limicola]ACD90787.1 Osmosensitive K channel His kinase sensor [Chlorobium limicola DSM 245]
MENNRPDSFLRLIQRSRRGKLKIYLGYSAGVGKTFQMLQEAGRMKENDIDVVAGIVETHGRKETEALLSGLEIIPRKSMVYRGIEITEMDIDAILRRQPSVVLVDELAHTNVPGSQNAKRYEDVEEILAAGIHVISTLNIQHLESLYETVEQATGIKVRERVPDRILAMADQLVNVDCTTDDLRQRLSDGKVYIAERTETALANFFRSENLEQLRELSLRELASQIDSRRRNQPVEDSQTNPDQLMVCLSSKSRNCETILRYASRIAGRLNRNWYAVYVRTFAENPAVIDPAVQRMLSNTLTLAQNLGATVFTYKGDDVVKTILQFAHEYRVGHIIIGNSGRQLSLWQRIQGRKTIVERLIGECRGISVIVLDTRGEETLKLRKNPVPSLSGIRETLLQVKPPEQSWKTLIRNVQPILWEHVVEKEDAFRTLLHECCRLAPEIDENEAMRCLLEREQQGSTFIGEEIAIPHARLERLNKPLVAIGISKVGIYDPNSSNTARIMFLVLSPLADPNSHVKLLGIISKTASDSQWKSRVLRAADKKELLKILRTYP